MTSTDQDRLFEDPQEQVQGSYEEPVEQEQQDLSPEETPEQVEPQEERVDWKAKAIEAETRARMLEEMRQREQAPPQQAQPQVSEVDQLRQEIEEKRAAMPALDDKNPQSFWERERAKEEISGLQERLYDARLRQQESYLMEQQVGTVVQSFKAQHVNRPEFKAIQPQFDQAVQQLQPHLRGNETMLDMIRKNLEYDYMQNNRNQRRPPPQAPSGAYQPQAQAQPRQNKVQWKSPEDQRVGEYYMRRGIISGPEEFYDPRYNERSPEANNNGIAIYDVPKKSRGWRR